MSPKFRLEDTNILFSSAPIVGNVARIEHTRIYQRCDNPVGPVGPAGNRVSSACDLADSKNIQEDRAYQRCDCNKGETSPGCSLADPKEVQEDIRPYAKVA